MKGTHGGALAAAIALSTLVSAARADETPATNTPPPPTPATPATPATSAPDAAEQPLLKEIPPPALAFEAGGGLAGFLGGTAATGPAWNARVTATFTPRWAAELGYLGAVNHRHDDNTNMVTTEVDASARYNFPRGQMPVQPFVTGGLGYAGFSGVDGDRAALVVPFGVGAERMLTQNVKVSARFNYRPVFGEDLRTPADRAANVSGPGGDTWAILVHLGGGF